MKFNKFLLTFLVVLILGTLLSFVNHKFYMSQTNVWYNPETKSLEIIVDLFVDDFEKVIEHNSGEKLFLNSPKEHPKADSLVFDYFEKHFSVSQDESRIPLDFIGKEVKVDHLFLYVESRAVNNNESFLFNVDLLVELFYDQINRINFEYNENIQSAALSKDNQNTTFKN